MKKMFSLLAIAFASTTFAQCVTNCSDVCLEHLYGNCTHWGQNCTTICDHDGDRAPSSNDALAQALSAAAQLQQSKMVKE